MFDLNLKDYGFGPAEFSFAENYIHEYHAPDLIPGRVIECRRERYRVVCERGEVPAELKGSFYHQLHEEGGYPVAGDFVLIKYNGEGTSLIAAVMPRRSKFSRADLSGHEEEYAKRLREEVAAANFDYIFILSSLNHNFNLGRLSRYLTASRQSGGFPVIILTKADLCDDPGALATEARKISREAPVIALSARTGYGINDLEPFLEYGKTAVLFGSSGVGKSSLLNTLAGETLMEVKEIREDDSKGRHTTTHRQLFRLPSGALIIDTPGMREIALFDTGEALSLAFSDVEDVIAQCRFSNCTHSGEPGCAVREALEEGRITEEQWRNYRKQQREARYVEQRTAYLKEKLDFHKSLARRNRAKNKDRGPQ